MTAKVELNNGTSIYLSGTDEEIADCYVMILENLLALHKSRQDDDKEDDPLLREISQGLPPASAVKRDEEIDSLLDYINRLKSNQDNGNQDNGNQNKEDDA